MSLWYKALPSPPRPTSRPLEASTTTHDAAVKSEVEEPESESVNFEVDFEATPTAPEAGGGVVVGGPGTSPSASSTRVATSVSYLAWTSPRWRVGQEFVVDIHEL